MAACADLPTANNLNNMDNASFAQSFKRGEVGGGVPGVVGSEGRGGCLPPPKSSAELFNKQPWGGGWTMYGEGGQENPQSDPPLPRPPQKRAQSTGARIDPTGTNPPGPGGHPDPKLPQNGT